MPAEHLPEPTVGLHDDQAGVESGQECRPVVKGVRRVEEGQVPRAGVGDQPCPGIGDDDLCPVREATGGEVRLDEIGVGAGAFDEHRTCCATRQRLDPEGTRPCEQVEHGGPDDGAPAVEGIEHRFPYPVTGGTDSVAMGSGQPEATCGSGHDAHDSSMGRATGFGAQVVQVATLASMRAPTTIICVDCGGTCHLLAHPEVEFEPGDPVAYRCADCMDRWDIVMPDHDDEGGAPD